MYDIARRGICMVHGAPSASITIVPVLPLVHQPFAEVPNCLNGAWRNSHWVVMSAAGFLSWRTSGHGSARLAIVPTLLC